MLCFHLLHLEGKVITKAILSPNCRSGSAERDDLNPSSGDVRRKGVVLHKKISAEDHSGDPTDENWR